MVYVHYSLNSSLSGGDSLEKLSAGLSTADAARIRRALEFIEPIYAGNTWGRAKKSPATSSAWP